MLGIHFRFTAPPFLTIHPNHFLPNNFLLTTLTLPPFYFISILAMSSAPSHQHPHKRRRVFGELAEWDLNPPRPFSKRIPITLDQENIEEIHDGLYQGVYDIDEIFAITDGTWTAFPAPMAPPEELSDDDDVIFNPVGDGSASDIELQDGHHNDDDNGPEGEQYQEGFNELMQGLEQGHNGDNPAPDPDGDEFAYDEHGDRIEPDEDLEETEQLQHSMFDPSAIGLREINNLAHFGVSSHKPGNGVEELLTEDLDKYWQ